MVSFVPMSVKGVDRSLQYLLISRSCASPPVGASHKSLCPSRMRCAVPCSIFGTLTISPGRCHSLQLLCHLSTGCSSCCIQLRGVSLYLRVVLGHRSTRLQLLLQPAPGSTGRRRDTGSTRDRLCRGVLPASGPGLITAIRSSRTQQDPRTEDPVTRCVTGSSRIELRLRTSRPRASARGAPGSASRCTPDPRGRGCSRTGSGSRPVAGSALPWRPAPRAR